MSRARTIASLQGLGTGDSPQFAAVNLGHATNTTLSQVSAGVLQVESTSYAPVPPVDAKEDAWCIIRTSILSGLSGTSVIDFDQSSGNQSFLGSNVTESGGSITISVAGLYFVNYYLHHYGDTAGDDDVRVYVDAAAYGHRGYLDHSGSAAELSSSIIAGGGPVLCPDGNEVIDIRGNGDFYSAAAAAAQCYFTGIRIGALS